MIGAPRRMIGAPRPRHACPHALRLQPRPAPLRSPRSRVICGVSHFSYFSPFPPRCPTPCTLGQVRIYKVRKVSKKSKDWVADPANKICDAPGSWYCNGQYPPALQSFINKRRAFKQLEDFNVKQYEHSRKYNEEYMRRMGGGGAKKSEL